MYLMCLTLGLMDASLVPSLLEETRGYDTSAFLSWALTKFAPGTAGPTLAFASSLGMEDQLLLSLLDTALAGEGSPDHRLHAFTLDTGRLPGETYDLMQTNRGVFRLPVVSYAPEAAAVEALVARGGPNLFYESVENRKACCAVRKVAPLGRALAGRQAWITGLRRAQSVTRTDLERIEWDAAHGLIKLNPLLDWTLEQVQVALEARNVPVNALHAQGYPSLGCAPCTRAVKPGEDERAGRWWWESADKKECGLHADPTAPTPKKTFSFGKLG